MFNGYYIPEPTTVELKMVRLLKLVPLILKSCCAMFRTVMGWCWKDLCMCRIESSSSSSNTTTQTMAEYLQENGQTLNSRLEFSIGIICLCSYRCDCYVHVGPLDSVITVQYTQCPDDMHSFPRRCCQSASEPPRTIPGSKFKWAWLTKSSCGPY